MNDNRRKVTDILKLLYENTDRDHYMDTYQIIDALERMGHSRPDRKTIDANIRFISEDLEYGIEKEKGKPNKYRWVNRMFELEELETIADAIETSSFIGPKTSSHLIAKLKDLTSVHKASLLDREVIVSSSYKHPKPYCRELLNKLSIAIKSGQAVIFRLAEYDLDKNEVLSSENYIELTPCRLIWDGCHYFVAGKSADDPAIRIYRLSRIRDLSLTDKKTEIEAGEFNPDQYTAKVFDMEAKSFCGVELCCKNHTISDIIDKFGKEFDVTRISDEQFIAKVYTDISPAFYAWVFRFGGDIRINGPDDVVKGYADMLAKQR